MLAFRHCCCLKIVQRVIMGYFTTCTPVSDTDIFPSRVLLLKSLVWLTQILGSQIEPTTALKGFFDAYNERSAASLLCFFFYFLDIRQISLNWLCRLPLLSDVERHKCMLGRTIPSVSEYQRQILVMATVSSSSQIRHSIMPVQPL